MTIVDGVSSKIISDSSRMAVMKVSIMPATRPLVDIGMMM